MVSANRFRDLVSAYLSGIVDLESFSNQFALLSSDVEDRGDAESVSLSYRIESALADVSAGLATETALRSVLSLISIHTVVKEYFMVPPDSTFKKRDEAVTGPLAVDLEYA